MLLIAHGAPPDLNSLGHGVHRDSVAVLGDVGVFFNLGPQTDDGEPNSSHEFVPHRMPRNVKKSSEMIQSSKATTLRR